MLLIEQRCEAGVPTARLTLPYDSRNKSRLRCKLEDGEELGLFLPSGSVLRGGDLLLASDGRVVEVVSAPEALMEVRVTDTRTLARAAYHLGNRHVPVEVRDEALRFAADHVLAKMLVGLGVAVTEVIDAFEPESGAYGHSHGHTTPGARIHQYSPRK